MKLAKLLIITLFAPLCAEAQTLSVAECVDIALQHNSQITAAQSQLSAARHDLRQARSYFLPQLSLYGTALYSAAEGGYSSGSGLLPVVDAQGNPTGQFAGFPGIDLHYDLGLVYGGGIQLEQPIYMGGRIRASYQLARIGEQAAIQQQRLTTSEVVVNTSDAYAQLVRATELRRVALAYNTLLTELHRKVQAAVNAGLSTRNDLLKVEVRLNDSRLQLLRADNGITLARMNLCHYLGRPLIDSIAVDAALPYPDALPPRSDISIDNRAEYQLLQHSTDAAERRVDIARSDMLPQVGMVGQFGYLNGLDLNGSKMMHSWNYFVGLQVSMPLFDFGRNRAKLQAARDRYHQALADQLDSSELLTLQANQAYNQLSEAFLEVEMARATVASAEENLRTSRLNYEAGLETLSDHLEAQLLWQQALTTQVETRITLYLSHLRYLQATGRL